MDTTGRPNPNEAFPNPDFPRLCFIKNVAEVERKTNSFALPRWSNVTVCNVVKNPRIIIGDYTYYDDVDGADQFEKHVTHFYDFISNPNPYLENKKLLIIPGATYCDLYDDGECDRSGASSTKGKDNYIPWDILSEFFRDNLKKTH